MCLGALPSLLGAAARPKAMVGGQGRGQEGMVTLWQREGDRKVL